MTARKHLAESKPTSYNPSDHKTLHFTAGVIRTAVCVVAYSLIWCLTLTLAWIFQNYISIWHNNNFNKGLDYLTQGTVDSFKTVICISIYGGIFLMLAGLHATIALCTEFITGTKGRGIVLHSVVIAILIGLAAGYVFDHYGPTAIGTFRQPGLQFAYPVVAACLAAGFWFARIYKGLQPRDTRYGVK